MSILKKTIEPFNLFGEGSLINSKEEAAKILKDNSYYFVVAALLALALYLFFLITKNKIFVSQSTILAYSIFYFVLAYTIRQYKSRFASIVAFVSFAYLVFYRVVTFDIGGFFFFSLIFLAASYRCVNASFFYHKKV